MSETRELGPEMAAEGWGTMPGADDYLFWLHAPSQRSVMLESCRRHNAVMPCWGPEPSDPQANGFVVACRTHDEHGNPIFGDAFWVESYATAIRMARRIRQSILDERPSDAPKRREEVSRRRNDWLRDLFRGCK